MIRAYEVKYIDWKGRAQLVYYYATSEQEAREAAMKGQGVFKIVEIRRVTQ